MHVSLEPGRARIPAESLDTATNSGYFWRDIERTEADWYRDAAQRLDTHLRDHRLVSSLNGQQTQFYDDIDNYDLLVLRVLDIASQSVQLTPGKPEPTESCVG